MKASKHQIVTGLSRYAKSEVIPKVVDKPTKIALAVIVGALENNHALLDSFLENSIISTAFQESDGAYDLDVAEAMIVPALEEYGGLPIKLPAIKFISPEVKEMTFSAEDIRILKEYIANV